MNLQAAGPHWMKCARNSGYPGERFFTELFWRLPKTMKSIFLVRHRFTTTKFILFNAKIPFDEK